MSAEGDDLYVNLSEQDRLIQFILDTRLKERDSKELIRCLKIMFGKIRAEYRYNNDLRRVFRTFVDYCREHTHSPAIWEEACLELMNQTVTGMQLVAIVHIITKLFKHGHARRGLRKELFDNFIYQISDVILTGKRYCDSELTFYERLQMFDDIMMSEFKTINPLYAIFGTLWRDIVPFKWDLNPQEWEIKWNPGEILRACSNRETFVAIAYCLAKEVSRSCLELSTLFIRKCYEFDYVPMTDMTTILSQVTNIDGDLFDFLVKENVFFGVVRDSNDLWQYSRKRLLSVDEWRTGVMEMSLEKKATIDGCKLIRCGSHITSLSGKDIGCIVKKSPWNYEYMLRHCNLSGDPYDVKPGQLTDVVIPEQKSIDPELEMVAILMIAKEPHLHNRYMGWSNATLTFVVSVYHFTRMIKYNPKGTVYNLDRMEREMDPQVFLLFLLCVDCGRHECLRRHVFTTFRRLTYVHPLVYVLLLRELRGFLEDENLWVCGLIQENTSRLQNRNYPHYMRLVKERIISKEYVTARQLVSRIRSSRVGSVYRFIETCIRAWKTRGIADVINAAMLQTVFSNRIQFVMEGTSQRLFDACGMLFSDESRNCESLKTVSVLYCLFKENNPEIVPPNLDYLYNCVQQVLTEGNRVPPCTRKLASVCPDMSTVVDLSIKKKLIACPNSSREVIIRRDNLLQDTMKHMTSIARQRQDVEIKFVGELGIDSGGLTREWLSLVWDLLVENNLFVPTPDGSHLEVNPDNRNIDLYKLAGQVLGLALTIDEAVNARLTLAVFAVMSGNPVSLALLADTDPVLYSSLKWMETNSVNDLCVTFSTQINGCDVELIPNGCDTFVTDETKSLYVEKVVQYRLYESVSDQLHAMAEGFKAYYKPCYSAFLDITDVRTLICGCNRIDFDDWERHIECDSTKVRRMFFSVIRQWDQEKISALLRFCTGSPLPPFNGFAGYASKGRPFEIRLNGKSGQMPESHTCFNQLSLAVDAGDLTAAEFERKLLYAISESRDFQMK